MLDPADARTGALVAAMREDEARHRRTALELGAAELPAPLQPVSGRPSRGGRRLLDGLRRLVWRAAAGCDGNFVYSSILGLARGRRRHGDPWDWAPAAAALQSATGKSPQTSRTVHVCASWRTTASHLPRVFSPI
jgi:hypothetical protein